ncbi:MAG TPA: TrbI/VirB10 family protein [Opitutaceae bacterium]|jgi:hypothetical protein|nr:TrbI/VirB10 family protein [Opitutaceae bacterium]
MSEPEPRKPPFWARLTLRTWLLLGLGVALVAATLSTQPKLVDAKPEARRAAALPTRLAPEELTATEADHEAPAVSGFRREVDRPKPVQNVAESDFPRSEGAVAAPGVPAARRRDEKKSLPEIFRMPGEAPVQSASRGAQPQALALTGARRTPEIFAPFGRLIKCQLVDTLDSVTARSEPIVAIVTQDLDWEGHVIIPAGSEAFSYAAAAPVIDSDGVGRLVDSGEWTLVLTGGPGENGRELTLKGRAVNRQESVLADKAGVRSWGLDDGADGLVGYTLSTLDNKEIKLFAAAAASGMAQGLSAIAERQVPAAGVSGVLGATQVAPTLGNAAIGSLGTGAVDAMNEMTERIRQEISKRGIYVRVPAGKAFYLFVEQTIDPAAAQVGLRLPTEARVSQ